MTEYATGARPMAALNQHALEQLEAAGLTEQQWNRTWF
jgi:hypothetical protein